MKIVTMNMESVTAELRVNAENPDKNIVIINSKNVLRMDELKEILAMNEFLTQSTKKTAENKF